MRQASRAPTVSVACSNFATVWGDKEKNLRKILDITHTAASSGSDIVVFPELALSGYECESAKGCRKEGLHKKLAEPVPGPSVEAVEEAAKKDEITVVYGFPERASGDSDSVFNSAAVVGPGGLLGVYRKLNLSPPPLWSEQYCFEGGARRMKQIPIFKTPKAVLGVSTCYDFYLFPEISRIEALKGADLIVNPTASGSTPGGEPQPHLEVITSARATENNCYAASANLVGTERTRRYYGRSIITGPDLHRQSRVYAVGGGGEELVTASLSLEKLDYIRKRVPHLRDRERYSADILRREFEGFGGAGATGPGSR